MASRGPRFAAIPNIPQSGLTELQFATLNAMKENIELLTGVRGSTNAVRALLSGQVLVNPPRPQTMTRVSAADTGFTVGGANVASLDEFRKLIQDVQQLANDVGNLQATLNALINQLKA
jgi:hypothetical protein